MTDIEDIVKPFWFKKISEDDLSKSRNFLDDYYFNRNTNYDNLRKQFINYQSKNNFSTILKFGVLITIYKLSRLNNYYVKPNKELEKYLKVQNVREQSGVMVFTIFTSAYPSYTKINPDGTTEIVKEYDETLKENTGEFTCPENCSFCPKDPNMPKSYIATEPGVARAVQNDFDPMKQIIDRGTQYLQQGHPIDKIELLILGGTWCHYSKEYRTEFVRDIYWTFNIFTDYIFYNKEKADLLEDPFIFKNRRLRKKLSLKEEIKYTQFLLYFLFFLFYISRCHHHKIIVLVLL